MTLLNKVPLAKHALASSPFLQQPSKISVTSIWGMEDSEENEAMGLGREKDISKGYSANRSLLLLLLFLLLLLLVIALC